MNLLIIGGLLGIALLAILGVVLLSIGEQSDRKKATALAQAQAAQTAQTMQAATPVAPATAVPTPVTPESRAVSPMATIPLRPMEAMDGNVSGRLPSRTLQDPQRTISRPLSHPLALEATPDAVQSGQLYDMIEELQELRQQAAQIESRLGLLSEMLNQMQQERYQEPVALGE